MEKSMSTKHSNVRLRSFAGSTEPVASTQPKDNFWVLLGQHGVIIDDQQPNFFPLAKGYPRKVLVKFSADLDAFGLSNHNAVKNSL
jgi:acetylornithine/N-succinyldiaminopimelate aminotransferase